MLAYDFFVSLLFLFLSSHLPLFVNIPTYVPRFCCLVLYSHNLVFLLLLSFEYSVVTSARTPGEGISQSIFGLEETIKRLLWGRSQSTLTSYFLIFDHLLRWHFLPYKQRWVKVNIFGLPSTYPPLLVNVVCSPRCKKKKALKLLCYTCSICT